MFHRPNLFILLSHLLEGLLDDETIALNPLLMTWWKVEHVNPPPPPHPHCALNKNKRVLPLWIRHRNICMYLVARGLLYCKGYTDHDETYMLESEVKRHLSFFKG